MSLDKFCMRCRRRQATLTRRDARGYKQYICEACNKKVNDIMDVKRRKINELPQARGSA